MIVQALLNSHPILSLIGEKTLNLLILEKCPVIFLEREDELFSMTD